MNCIKSITYILLTLYLVFILQSCKNGVLCQDEIKSLTIQLEKTQKELAECKRIDSLININQNKTTMSSIETLEHFKAFGHFCTGDDILKLFIPVTSERFTVEEQFNLVSGNISTFLVRVTDQTHVSRLGEPISHILTKEYNLTQQGFDIGRLRTENQLKVFIINSNDSIRPTEIDAVETCLENETDINSMRCLDEFRNKEIVIPNDRKGNIIIGL